MELEQKLTEITADLKTFKEKAQEEIKLSGSVATETKTAVDAMLKRVEQMQAQLDAVDAKSQTASVRQQQSKSIGELFVDSEEFKTAQKRGFKGRKDAVQTWFENRAAFDGEQKTVITTGTIGGQTTGVVQLDRLAGITITAMQGLRIRDLMPVRTLSTGNSYDWVAQKTRTNAPSPQVEGSAKAESTYLWEAKTDSVKTIAHFTNVTRQALDDVAWLQGQINSELMYGLKLKEESEILSGDGTGQHLNGLITQATPYAGTYNVAGDTKLDTLRHAKLEARVAGLATFAPDAFVLNPVDMQKIELIKTEEGGANKGVYVIGDPKSGNGITYVWNLPVVESDSITAGKFLVGAFRTAAELVDRMQASIDVSFEHDLNFTKNLATILCEERIGMAVRRPNAFIYGSI